MKLKPCPFCGRDTANLFNDWATRSGTKWRVSCLNNCAEIPKGENNWFRDREQAAMSWNTRPIEDELRERIAELEAALTPEEIESILDGNAKFLDKRHAECDKIEDENEVLRKRIAELETALWRCEHERISKL